MGGSKAPRLARIQIGSVVFAGQSANHNQIPFLDSRGSWTRMGRDEEVVRETPDFWITESGAWYRKKDGLRSPASPVRLYLVPAEKE